MWSTHDHPYQKSACSVLRTRSRANDTLYWIMITRILLIILSNASPICTLIQIIFFEILIISPINYISSCSILLWNRGISSALVGEYYPTTWLSYFLSFWYVRWFQLYLEKNHEFSELTFLSVPWDVWHLFSLVLSHNLSNFLIEFFVLIK